MTAPPTPGPPASVPSWASFAKHVCLLTCTKASRLTSSGGRLTIPPKGRDRTAGKVERAVSSFQGPGAREFPPSAYFYAGRAYTFGDACFAYHPAAETGHTGSANPFDTGSTMDKHSHPFKAIADEDDLRSRAIRLILDTWSDLSSWRAYFARYAHAFFDSPHDYVRSNAISGPKPRPGVPWPNPDLPAVHAEDPGWEADWRAWAMEVRFYEDHPIHKDLFGWTCTESAKNALITAAASSSNAPATAPTTWIQGLGAPLHVGPDYCAELQDLAYSQAAHGS